MIPKNGLEKFKNTTSWRVKSYGHFVSSKNPSHQKRSRTLDQIVYFLNFEFSFFSLI